MRKAVSTHSRPKAAAVVRVKGAPGERRFNTQPPEGGCFDAAVVGILPVVSTHSRPKAAAVRHGAVRLPGDVSTHSRPKAAAKAIPLILRNPLSFNTQPPEGGCINPASRITPRACFNTQPPEGGCDDHARQGFDGRVSTHSRPKAAAGSQRRTQHGKVSFNTQPPEGGCLTRAIGKFRMVTFQHTAARRRLPIPR